MKHDQTTKATSCFESNGVRGRAKEREIVNESISVLHSGRESLKKTDRASIDHPKGVRCTTPSHSTLRPSRGKAFTAKQSPQSLHTTSTRRSDEAQFQKRRTRRKTHMIDSLELFPTLMTPGIRSFRHERHEALQHTLSLQSR